jgi:hypothetical protein
VNKWNHVSLTCYITSICCEFQMPCTSWYKLWVSHCNQRTTYISEAGISQIFWWFFLLSLDCDSRVNIRHQRLKYSKCARCRCWVSSCILVNMTSGTELSSTGCSIALNTKSKLEGWRCNSVIQHLPSMPTALAQPPPSETKQQNKKTQEFQARVVHETFHQLGAGGSRWQF